MSFPSGTHDRALGTAIRCFLPLKVDVTVFLLVAEVEARISCLKIREVANLWRFWVSHMGDFHEAFTLNSPRINAVKHNRWKHLRHTAISIFIASIVIVTLDFFFLCLPVSQHSVQEAGQQKLNYSANVNKQQEQVCVNKT